MEENENSGGECEKGNTVVENPVHVLTNGTNHLHQIENTLVVQKQLRNNRENGIENDPVIIKPYTNGNDPVIIKPYANGNDPVIIKPFTNGNDPVIIKPYTNGNDPVIIKPYTNGNDPVIIKPYTNGNGVHEENAKPYTNGFAKKKTHNGCTDGKYSFEHNGDRPKYMNGNHVKVPDENCPDVIGDTIDTLKQYTTQIDATLESLEQCQTELAQQLNSHNKTRMTTTTTTTEENTHVNNNHDDNNKNENHTNGTKNENHTKNENNRTEVNGDVSRDDDAELATVEYLPMIDVDDEDEGEVFPTIPDMTTDEDMLIQEKIMQSKSELVSKLNSQEQTTSLIINNQTELSNGHSTTTTTDGATCAETTSSSSSSSSDCETTKTEKTEKKELTLFESCRQGHYETVKEILRTRKDVDVNMTDGDSWSCLHEVSIRNCQFTPIVELLLQNGADPNLRDKKGETPLHGAVLFHLVDTIKLLLQYNGDCNICNNTNVSPLKLATYLKDNEILQLFGHPVTEEKTSSAKKKKKKKKRNSDKNFTLPLSTSPSILKKRRASDEPCSSTTTRSKKRINFSL